MAKANDLLTKLAKAKATPPAPPADVAPPPAGEPAPATPAPAAEPTAPPDEAAAAAPDPVQAVEPTAPPADAGGDTPAEPAADPAPLPNALVELPLGPVEAAELAGEPRPPVVRTGPTGLPLWRCHTQTQPDGLFEGATGDDALAAYRDAYGITGSAHPFVATPVYD